MLGTAFDDMPDDLSFSSAPAAPRQSAAPASAVTLYTEKCGKCNGSGRYTAPSTRGTVCFKCGGAGKFEFKTSPEYRKEQREKSAARKATKAQNVIDAWNAENPEAAAWIAAAAKREFGFAVAMAAELVKWSRLTAGQLAAVHRCIESDKTRAAEAAKRAETAPVVDTMKLKAAFDKASASGLKSPKITLGEIVVKPAKADSANAGALYVTEAGSYLGKVMGGKFLRVRACGEEQAQRIAELIADPKGAAEAYGKLTGRCCLCNRALTDEASVAAGIGPICESKWGL